MILCLLLPMKQKKKLIGDDLMTMERTRLAAMPEQRRLIYTLNRFENKTSPEIANEFESKL